MPDAMKDGSTKPLNELVREIAKLDCPELKGMSDSEEQSAHDD